LDLRQAGGSGKFPPVFFFFGEEKIVSP